MTYNNTFDSEKNYESVRYQFGQKPVSQEFNEAQSITKDQLSKALNTLFDSGFIYEGLDLLNSTLTSITLSSGTVHLDGFGRGFASSSLDISGVVGDEVEIFANVTYTNVTSTDDVDLVHPLQPDLPVANRAKAITQLTVGDPDLQSNPPSFISRVKSKILTYNKSTGILTRIVTNLGKFINLSNLPGQINVTQVAPGSIDTSQLDIQVDGLSILDALALRMEDANGSFLASGGAVIYEDNIITGSPQGVRLRIEALRAYIDGFLVKKDGDQKLYLDHTDTVKTRANESKVYSTGTLTYSLGKRPAKDLLALDGDVTVTDLDINRSLSGNLDTIPAPYNPVVSITSVTQSGGGPFVQGVDYQLSGDDIEWISGNRPTAGTTYQTTFVYRRAFVIPTDVDLGADRKTLVFTGTVLPNNTSSFQATYTYYIPRIDSISLNKEGVIEVYKGSPEDVPQRPVLPEKRFELARISLPAGTNLGNTFLSTNGYPVAGASNIDFRNIQIVASKMREHQQRYVDLKNLAFNDSINTALNYFVTKDPSLTKKGVFADGFYDDRLSDYGLVTQNMVFNSEQQRGEGSRTSSIQIMDRAVGTPLNAKFHGENFLTLDYSEVAWLDQPKYSGEINVDPFLISESPRFINCPNRNLVKGQTLTIEGRNWNFGENDIAFYINEIQLTSIVIITGSAGGSSDTVTPDASGSFIVEFVAPDTLPIGYRLIKAESLITGNNASTLLGIQTSATPLPASTMPPPPPEPACNALRRRKTGRRNWVVERYDCNTGQWIIIARHDPIAQTFVPDTDMFISSVEVYFTSKDPIQQVFGSIILTNNGEPDLSGGRLGLATVQPANVKTDGTSTKFVFDNPVWVQANTTYAFLLECAVPSYRVQYAELGGIDRSQYSVTPGGFFTITSSTSSPIGPMLDVADANKRDRSTTYRFIEKAMNFTVSQARNVYSIDAQVYVGPDLSSTDAALVHWELIDTTANTILWSESRFLNNHTIGFATRNAKDGKFCVKGFQDKFPEVRSGNDSIPAPIGLVTGHNYTLKVRADQAFSGYKFIRDDYPADGILNAKITTFTPATTTFNVVNKNAILNGLLWASPDLETWQPNPNRDLRIRINRADFTGKTDSTITFKPFLQTLTDPPNQVLLDDVFTHFTTLLNAIQPKGTSITMEYSLDNGLTYLPHVPTVFKPLEFDNDVDRENWAFYNFGFFSENRFRENQIDPQFVPSNPNKAVSIGSLTGNLSATQILFRLKLHTDDLQLTPVIDISNWAVNFEKYGLQTVYHSRTSELLSDATEVKVYVWANIPSSVSLQVALTLDGDNTVSPVYITKTTPTSTRVVDGGLGIVEYQYDFSSGDISGQTDKRHPKLQLTYTTTDRFQQPITTRVAINSL